MYVDNLSNLWAEYLLTREEGQWIGSKATNVECDQR